jgi:hypothetical protein
MTPEEIAIRRPVWVAMSDLFLDTDVSLFHEHIARVCAESRFTIGQLESIFNDEVAPLVGSNLLSVAGEWAAFDEEWLVSQIEERLDRKWPLPSMNPAAGKWRPVAQLIVSLRGKRSR